MSYQRQTVLLFEDNTGDARLIRESLTDLSGNMFDLETADRLPVDELNDIDRH